MSGIWTSTYDFITAEQEATLGITLNTAQAFIVGFWGGRCQVKDVQRAITFYTLGFNRDVQNLPAFGQGSILRPQFNPERTWGVWASANTRWPSTRARRMESCAPSGAGFA
jgi:hypothetical protein